MPSFRSCLAFDLVDFGWFQAPPGRRQPIFGPIRHYFDVNLLCRGQIRSWDPQLLDRLWKDSVLAMFLAPLPRGSRGGAGLSVS